MRQAGCFAQFDLNRSTGELYSAAYSVLARSDNRHEYVYRAEVTNKILLGRHSLNTSSMVPELRVGANKVDLAIFNGVSTAYEIKSERDDLSRLNDQLEAFKTFFQRVVVVCSEAHAEAVLSSQPDEIGVCVLTSRMSIRQLRAPGSCEPWADVDTIHRSLRREEARAVLRHLGIHPPQVPNTLEHSTVRSMLTGVPVSKVQEAANAVLRKSRSQAKLANFVREVPRAVVPAWLRLRPDSQESKMLVAAMRQPVMDSLVEKKNVSPVPQRKAVRACSAA